MIGRENASRRDAAWAIGLGSAAVLTGAAFLHGGRLSRPELVLGPLAAAGLAAAFARGLVLSPAVAPFRRIAAGLSWAAAFSLLLVLPVGIDLLTALPQFLWERRAAGRVEAKGGLESVRKASNAGGWGVLVGVPVAATWLLGLRNRQNRGTQPQTVGAVATGDGLPVPQPPPYHFPDRH